MVRPAKPSDIKVGISGQKMSRKMLRPDIEDRYRTEAPKQKKAPVEKNTSKSPPNSAGGSLLHKNTTDKMKPVSPAIPRLAKFNTLQSDTGVAKKVSVPKSKSQTKSPVTTAPKKSKKRITKKVDSKDSPLFRLLHDRDDKPSSPGDETKTKTANKVGRIVSGIKKTKKSSLKKSAKSTSKNLSFNLKPTSDSIVSLTTHFRMPFMANEPALNRKPTPKKRKPTSVQKKTSSKSKGDQEDTTKTKTKRKKNYKSRRVNAGTTNLIA